LLGKCIRSGGKDHNGSAKAQHHKSNELITIYKLKENERAIKEFKADQKTKEEENRIPLQQQQKTIPDQIGNLLIQLTENSSLRQRSTWPLPQSRVV
jgi:hypothetical protein